MAISYKKAVKKKTQWGDYLAEKDVVAPVKGHKSVSKHASGAMVHEQASEEKVSDGAFVPPHLLAQVYVSGSSTINLGNFESAKITVGLTFPCHKDEIVSAYEFASDWVSDRLNAATKEVKKNGD